MPAVDVDLEILQFGLQPPLLGEQLLVALVVRRRSSLFLPYGVVQARRLGFARARLFCASLCVRPPRPRAPSKARRSSRLASRGDLRQRGDLSVLAREPLVGGLKRRGVALQVGREPAIAVSRASISVVQFRDPRFAGLELRVDALPFGMQASDFGFEMREPESGFDGLFRSLRGRRACRAVRLRPSCGAVRLGVSAEGEVLAGRLLRDVSRLVHRYRYFVVHGVVPRV